MTSALLTLNKTVLSILAEDQTGDVFLDNILSGLQIDSVRLEIDPEYIWELQKTNHFIVEQYDNLKAIDEELRNGPGHVMVIQQGKTTENMKFSCGRSTDWDFSYTHVYLGEHDGTGLQEIDHHGLVIPLPSGGYAQRSSKSFGTLPTAIKMTHDIRLRGMNNETDKRYPQRLFIGEEPVLKMCRPHIHKPNSDQYQSVTELMGMLREMYTPVP
ncbi:MAG: hypothetical protein ABIH34_00725 [Nanoarchaeota archaeon]